MKKLTIGSLKAGATTNLLAVNRSAKTAVNPIVDKPKRFIDIKQNETHFQVKIEKNQSILDAALDQNLSLDYKCQKGTCGKCKVKVLSGESSLQQANSLERKKLNHLLLNGFRLACQARAK